MSAKHPIIAITGASETDTQFANGVFSEIFRREKINAVYIKGNSFRRYQPHQLRSVFFNAARQGKPISHFGPETNYFDRLESLFREYARQGTGLAREYISNQELSERYQQKVGSYSPWHEIHSDSDMLFYTGHHGGCIEATWSRRPMSASHNPIIINERHRLRTRNDAGVDIARWVDLLIGIVPNINLEWIQKIHRDNAEIGRSPKATVQTILRRLPDYVRYITPQFSLTDINFQRIPLVDTSNPFIARSVPHEDESMIVIRFREPKKFNFSLLLSKLQGAFMSRPNTLVVPGGQMANALDTICSPLVQQLHRRQHAFQHSESHQTHSVDEPV